jgi:type VI protein secretion system component VasF
MTSNPAFFNSTLVEPFLSFCSSVEGVLPVASAEAVDARTLPTEDSTTAEHRAAAMTRTLCDMVARLESDLLSRIDAAQISLALPNFRYLLAAWADERLLRNGIEPGVEKALFGTTHAGEQIFANIEEALERRWPVDELIAPTFLLALSLGFEGRHFNDPDPEHIPRLRKQLQAFVCLPATLSHESIPRSLEQSWVYAPRRAQWLACCAIVWSLAIVFASWVWYDATVPMKDWLEQAESSPSFVSAQECQ